MTSNSERDIRAGDADREAIARRLAVAAGEGRISTSELEERLDRVHQARTYGDLDELVADLPGVAEPLERTVPEHTVPETLHISAALRDARRRGGWRVPERVVASAGLGYVYLDFTEAEFAQEQVTIDARPHWGHIVLTVPEGCTVTTEDAVPGASAVVDRTTAPPQNGMPGIHIVARPGEGCIHVQHPHRRARGLFGRRASTSRQGA